METTTKKRKLMPFLLWVMQLRQSLGNLLSHVCRDSNEFIPCSFPEAPWSRACPESDIVARLAGRKITQWTKTNFQNFSKGVAGNFRFYGTNTSVYTSQDSRYLTWQLFYGFMWPNTLYGSISVFHRLEFTWPALLNRKNPTGGCRIIKAQSANLRIHAILIHQNVYSEFCSVKILHLTKFIFLRISQSFIRILIYFRQNTFWADFLPKIWKPSQNNSFMLVAGYGAVHE